MGNGISVDCAACTTTDMANLSRRSFFGSLLGAGSLLIGAIVGAPLVRFVLYPVLAKGRSSEWSAVGEIGEFETSNAPVSKTIALSQRDGWREVVTAQSVYVTRGPGGHLQVLSAICPHLGWSVAQKS